MASSTQRLALALLTTLNPVAGTNCPEILDFLALREGTATPFKHRPLPPSRQIPMLVQS